MSLNKLRALRGLSLAVIVIMAAFSGPAFAGPVILGGDDLTDHGFRSGDVNFQGWKYIQKAIENLIPAVTRTGPFTVTVAALGSADPGAVTPNMGCCDAGRAIKSAVANVAGASVAFFNGSAAIGTFFTDLASGAVNPQIIWTAGTGASNDLDFAGEGAALTANAAAINSFVASGGGVLSHGSGTEAYGWLQTLLPGINFPGGCSSTGATLTPAGIAAFPGLNNSDIDGNAGPCHNHFTGDFGGLVTLANDAQQRPYIIGTGQGGLIQCGQPGQPACPPPPGGNEIPEPGTMVMIGIGLAGAALRKRFKKATA